EQQRIRDLVGPNLALDHVPASDGVVGHCPSGKRRGPAVCRSPGRLILIDLSDDNASRLRVPADHTQAVLEASPALGRGLDAAETKPGSPVPQANAAKL